MNTSVWNIPLILNTSIQIAQIFMADLILIIIILNHTHNFCNKKIVEKI